MNILHSLIQLPAHLLLISLVLVTSALPVVAELNVLTPDDFDATVAEGVWFIEHYSPYCGHCKAFAPTWEKLVERYDQNPDSGVHLAQVNCAVHGDLCNAHDVKGYPQMNMYKNGKYVSKFSGAREWDLLVTFIDEYAEPPHIRQDSSSKTSSNGKTYNKDGTVLSLDSTSFQSVINDGPVFVKFFAPWCGHCRKMAPAWSELAKRMQNRLTIAEVNCDDHQAVCKAQNVQGYPTVIFFTGSEGGPVHKTEYTGGRNLEQMLQFSEMAISADVHEVKSSGDFDLLVKQQQTLFLLLHSSSDQQIVESVKDASRLLVGIPQILSSTSSELRNRFNLPHSHDSRPVLLSIKDGLGKEYTSSLVLSTQHGADEPALSEWLMRNSLPSALELSQDTFQRVMNAEHRPLVVLVAVSPQEKAGDSETVQDIARAWRRHKNDGSSSDRDVIFAWMDGIKWESWLKSMYGVRSSNLPAVIISDHQDLVYYDTDRSGKKFVLSTNSVLGAVEDTLAGKLRKKHSENIAERMARRLNNGIIALEYFVTHHPYYAVMLAVAALVGFVLFVRRFIMDESTPYSQQEYARLQKSPSRLD